MDKAKILKLSKIKPVSLTSSPKIPSNVSKTTGTQSNETSSGSKIQEKKKWCAWLCRWFLELFT